MTCETCGDKPKKCNKDFTKAVIEIDNPEQITLMRKVTIPASMGDDTTVPPVVGKYKNVLLYYEANQKSYLYSSDGIPTQLANGITDYAAATNLPQINSHTLIGDKTGDQLGLQDKLTAGDNISIENNVISATNTTYGPATDDTIGLVKPGDGLSVEEDGTLNVNDPVPEDFFTGDATKSSCGMEFTLDNMIGGKPTSFKLLGETEQDGTPSPSVPVPVNVVTGRQIISVNSNQYEIDLNCNIYDKSSAYMDGNDMKVPIDIMPGSTYAFKAPTRWVGAYLYNSSGTLLRTIGHTAQTRSGEFTAESGEVKAVLVFYAGSDVTWSWSDVEFYDVAGVIELCKIGDYQDYIHKSGDDWYVHKETAKIASYAGESIATDYVSTTGQLSTGATVYYALAISTDTRIMNEALIEQLDVVKLNIGTNLVSVASSDLAGELCIGGYSDNWNGNMDNIYSMCSDVNSQVTAFDTVPDMKASDSLTAGRYAITGGYYKINDGGSGTYAIRRKKDDDIIDDNKTVNLSDSLVGELVGASKTETKLGVNLWTRGENISDVKARIDVYKYMGVTDLVIVIQLDGPQCTVTENVGVVNQAIAYAKSKKIRVNTIKFHCTNSNLNDSAQYRDLYQQHCEDLLEAIENTTIERVIILNEKSAWFNDSATQEQVDICRNMVADFKALGYEVSITVAGLRYFMDCYYFHPEVIDDFDFIAVNDYPVIGDNKQFTSEKEIREAYETLYAFASQIKSLYPSKDFILSEIGVQNVWESLCSPANWRIASMAGVTSSEGKIIPLYFSGLLDDTRMSKIFSEVWLWYSEYYYQYPEQTKIFRNKFVGGNN